MTRFRNQGSGQHWPDGGITQRTEHRSFIHHASTTSIELLRYHCPCCKRSANRYLSQAPCRSIRALEMAAFKGEPFRETNEGHLKQRP